jgi:Rrf2 family protein
VNVSTKSEYGLRALMYLAAQRERSAIPAREIADRWSVPVKYLEQILKMLKEGGFVESQVGVGGGYRLARPPAQIVVGDVIRVLDGRLAPMGCVSSYDYVPCEFEPGCGLKQLWARTRTAILDVLDNTTVADLSLPRADGTADALISISRG